MELLELDIRVQGLENIPKEGGVILASNHPLGGVDAMALVPTVSKVRKDIKFIVNDILMNLTCTSANVITTGPRFYFNLAFVRRAFTRNPKNFEAFFLRILQGCALWRVCSGAKRPHCGACGS